MTGAANVDILLSIDGGMTYTLLLGNTPNDGSQDIVVPNTPAPYCRIMVQPTDQVNAPFFDINREFFSIDFLVENTCNTYTTGPISTAIPDGTGNVFIPISVTETANIEDIRIYTDVTHAWTGDLTIQIQEPNIATSGLFTNVWSRNCNTARFEDIDVTFKDNEPAIVCGTPTTGTYSSATNPLSIFNGINPQGIWNVVFVDSASSDAGTVNEVIIELCSETATPLSNDSFELNDFTLFPNPNNGEFNLSFNSNSGRDININVFDISGKRIFNQGFDARSTFDEQISLNTISSGIYIMTVDDGDRSVTKKIIIN